MRYVVVTGGTRGLGLAIVRQLVRDGFNVIAIGRQKTEMLEALAAEHPNQVHFEAFDFVNTSEIYGLSKRISDTYGRIYGLVNNAAIGSDGVLATMHESDIREVLAVNVEAPILLTKYLLRPMMLNKEGRIVNISSIMANTGFSGLSVYGASKSAMTGFTRSLCREVGRMGVTVNMLAPGYMQTEMTSSLQGEKLETIKRRSALGRLATVEDSARAVGFLMSSEAASITGTTITVDAGSTA